MFSNDSKATYASQKKISFIPWTLGAHPIPDTCFEAPWQRQQFLAYENKKEGISEMLLFGMFLG